MPDPTTNNLGLILMATGTASGSWGTVLNASMISITDAALGTTLSVPVSSSTVNLTSTQRQNLAFNLTGTLSGAINITLPLNPNSTTNAVGGFFIFDNESTGAFAVTVKTVASGSTGVEVPQGVRSHLYSDGTNIWFADDAQNRVQTYNGNPNGNVAGTAGSASTRASKIVDRSTNVEYLATTSGTASSTVWSVNLPYTFPSQGYLTASSDATSPILTGDSLGATTIYLTGYNGNNVFVYNGVSFVPVPITGGQMALALSSSSQASNGIYDVMFFLNGSTPTIGFSPGWQTATAGSGARGTGAGTPQLTRLNGVLVNTVQQTVNNGSTTYTVAANKGTYLGSVYIDASSGQVSCHVTYGQSRKWGVWNYYNRQPITLQGGDPAANWSYTTATIRESNGGTANFVTPFVGFAEERVSVSFIQEVSGNSGSGAISTIGIGWNSTTVMSGTSGYVSNFTTNYFTTVISKYNAAPFLGINAANMLEKGAGSASTFVGTSASMLMTAEYRG